MNIVVVDNSAADLSRLAEIITAILPDSKIQVFTDPLMSAKYICNNLVDMVFLTDVMRPANGFKLIQVLRQNIPKLPIVMLSANSMNEVNAMVAGGKRISCKSHIRRTVKERNTWGAALEKHLPS